MTDLIELEDYLRTAAAGQRPDAGRVVLAIAGAGREIAGLLAAEALAGGPAEDRANTVVLGALRAAQVRVTASAAMGEPVVLNAGAKLAVAVDALDGTSNVDALAPVGTIFSVLPALDEAVSDAAHFLQPGTRQVAAGVLIYGMRTALALTLGDGTRLFTLDRATGRFVARSEPARIPPETREFAIDGTNWRHWDEPVRQYVTHCLMGASGPRGVDFSTRWLESLTGEAWRILVRGGIYLCPGDARPGCGEGSLRLATAANPIAFLIEQAGGAASDGRQRILGLVPRALHQRVSFVFGSAREVECVRSFYEDERCAAAHPLFASRTLFRGAAAAGPFGVSSACP